MAPNMQLQILFFLTVLVLFQQQFVCGQLQCGTVGRVGSTRTGNMRNRARNEFYIDRGNRAECAGMITSISYCYHQPTEPADEYLATVAVYTPASSDDNEGIFTVSSSLIVIQKSNDEIETELGSSDFTCSELSLPEPVSVAVGDVLGACLFEPPDSNSVTRYRLDLVSRATGEGTVRTDTNPNTPAGCSATGVPGSFDLSDNDKQTASGRSLHLWANIDVPTDPPTEPTDPSVTDTTSLLTNEPGFITDQGGADPTTAQPLGRGEGGSNEATVAVSVVMVLLIVIVISVILVVAIVVLTKKQHKMKQSYAMNQRAVDNQLYSAVEHDKSLDKTKTEQQERGVWPAQSQEHVYEFEGSTNFTRSMNTYAEVGPLDVVNGGEIIYESPLDATAISYHKLLDQNKQEDIYVGENPYETPATRERDIYQQLEAWSARQLDNEQLEITRHLGSGQFGSVEQGVWKRQGTKPVDVALKSLTKTSEEDRVKFLQEAAIMAQFKHPNVIILHGVITNREPMMLVVELAEKGDLRQFLLSQKPDPGELMPGDTASVLLSYSQQVALGMQYLSAKGFVHRDLAARNVLVTANNQCKVADFGMSRDLADENYYVSKGKDAIPVKWTAPEAIHYKKYSTASDVWAYGCLLYEIWSLGHKPFEGVTNPKSLRLIDTGERLAPPPATPKMIYELMIMCWHPETSQRLGFRDIVLTLTGNEKMVLSIPEEDSSSHPLAGVLGATLEAGENMYTQLQNTYT